MQLKTCLSIAGFDGSGGAGLQADLKTCTVLGCYGMTVLTALPVQNTQGVRGCYELPLQAIQDQLAVIFSDVVPDAIKIGMLFSADIVCCVADFLRQYAINIPIVLDPVMVAKSGDALLQADAVSALKTQLVPLATLLTPNLPEAVALVGQQESPNAYLQTLLQLGCQSVLLKGGHATGEQAVDHWLAWSGEYRCFSSPRIRSHNTHGTGCTLSAAIAAYLAQGESVASACELAKNFLQQAIVSGKDCSVGRGHGPVNHLWNLI
jgi:hydroxymethylpyrimidine/phosphomethylpyrimidine kinase